MDAGTAGIALRYETAKQVDELVPQLLVTLTQMFPPLYVLPKSTSIEFVVDVPEAPAGNVQL